MDVSDEFKKTLMTLREHVDAMEKVCGMPSIDRSFLFTGGDLVRIFTGGDLVRSLGRSDHLRDSSRVPPKGHVGVVRRVEGPSTLPTILVEWESPWDGHNGRDGLIRRPGTGWWMNPSNLEPA